MTFLDTVCYTAALLVGAALGWCLRDFVLWKREQAQVLTELKELRREVNAPARESIAQDPTLQRHKPARTMFGPLNSQPNASATAVVPYPTAKAAAQ